MALVLYGHPFSSFTWKVEIALIEAGLPYELKTVWPETAGITDEWLRRWPFARMPVLADGSATVAETSIIIEHLQLRFPDSLRLIPADSKAALEVRLLDRMFDLHVQQGMQAPVNEKLRGDGRDDRLAEAMAEAARRLDTAYGWLEARLAGREWATGGAFSMADCAAAPALFYSDWVHPIPEDCPVLRAYRARLLDRASVARVVESARPYRPLFPLGAPHRD